MGQEMSSTTDIDPQQPCDTNEAEQDDHIDCQLDGEDRSLEEPGYGYGV